MEMQYFKDYSPALGREIDDTPAVPRVTVVHGDHARERQQPREQHKRRTPQHAAPRVSHRQGSRPGIEPVRIHSDIERN